MGLTEWLTHPLRCIGAIWYIHRVGPDTPIEIRQVQVIRTHAQIHHVMPQAEIHRARV